MAGQLLREQPSVNKVEQKRSTKRKGRTDVEYLVSFVDFPESEWDWFPANKLRKKHQCRQLENGAKLIEEYEARQGNHMGKGKAKPKQLPPQTQEPFFSQMGGGETQVQDLDMDTLLDNLAFKEAAPSTRADQAGQEGSPEEETPVGGRTRSKRNVGSTKITQGDSKTADNTSSRARESPSRANQRRLSPVAEALGGSGMGGVGVPLGSAPWIDEFDDCDSVYPPMAAVPGWPRTRGLAASGQLQGQGAPSRGWATPPQRAPASQYQPAHSPRQAQGNGVPAPVSAARREGPLLEQGALHSPPIIQQPITQQQFASMVRSIQQTEPAVNRVPVQSPQEQLTTRAQQPLPQQPSGIVQFPEPAQQAVDGNLGEGAMSPSGKPGPSDVQAQSSQEWVTTRAQLASSAIPQSIRIPGITEALVHDPKAASAAGSPSNQAKAPGAKGSSPAMPANQASFGQDDEEEAEAESTEQEEKEEEGGREDDGEEEGDKDEEESSEEEKDEEEEAEASPKEPVLSPSRPTTRSRSAAASLEPTSTGGRSGGSRASGKKRAAEVAAAPNGGMGRHLKGGGAKRARKEGSGLASPLASWAHRHIASLEGVLPTNDAPAPYAAGEQARGLSVPAGRGRKKARKEGSAAVSPLASWAHRHLASQVGALPRNDGPAPDVAGGQAGGLRSPLARWAHEHRAANPPATSPAHGRDTSPGGGLPSHDAPARIRDGAEQGAGVPSNAGGGQQRGQPSGQPRDDSPAQPAAGKGQPIAAMEELPEEEERIGQVENQPKSAGGDEPARRPPGRPKKRVSHFGRNASVQNVEDVEPVAPGDPQPAQSLPHATGTSAATNTGSLSSLIPLFQREHPPPQPPVQRPVPAPAQTAFVTRDPRLQGNANAGRNATVVMGTGAPPAALPVQATIVPQAAQPQATAGRVLEEPPSPPQAAPGKEARPSLSGSPRASDGGGDEATEEPPPIDPTWAIWKEKLAAPAPRPALMPRQDPAWALWGQALGGARAAQSMPAATAPIARRCQLPASFQATVRDPLWSTAQSNHAQSPPSRGPLPMRTVQSPPASMQTTTAVPHPAGARHQHPSSAPVATAAIPSPARGPQPVPPQAGARSPTRAQLAVVSLPQASPAANRSPAGQQPAVMPDAAQQIPALPPQASPAANLSTSGQQAVSPHNQQIRAALLRNQLHSPQATTAAYQASAVAQQQQPVSPPPAVVTHRSPMTALRQGMPSGQSQGKADGQPENGVEAPRGRVQRGSGWVPATKAAAAASLVILEETPEESPSPLGYGKRENLAKGKDASESSYQDAEDSPEESGWKDPTPKPRRPVTRSKKASESAPARPAASSLPARSGGIPKTGPQNRRVAPPKIGYHVIRDTESDSESDSDDEEFSDAKALPQELAERLTPSKWEKASIVGARQQDDGGLDLRLHWEDGFDAWVFHTHIKERAHCLWKLVNFYESKTKKKRTDSKQ